MGVTCVNGGVRVSRPARATKPRSDNPPEARTAVERRSLTGIARAAGETPGLSFAAWRPRRRERRGDICARVRRFAAFVSGFRDRAGFAACGRDAGRRPALRCRALGAGERCGGGWGVTSVNGGVRVSPARATKPRSDNLPEVRTAVERRSLTGIARAAGDTSRASFRRMAPSPKGTARRQLPARTSLRRLRFRFPRQGAAAPRVSRPAATMPVGDRRSAAARLARGSVVVVGGV